MYSEELFEDASRERARPGGETDRLFWRASQAGHHGSALKVRTLAKLKAKPDASVAHGALVGCQGTATAQASPQPARMHRNNFV